MIEIGANLKFTICFSVLWISVILFCAYFIYKLPRGGG